MLGYLYGKRFSSKIAWADQKEGNRVGVGPSRETACFSTLTHPYPITFLLIDPGYFQAKSFLQKNPQNSQPQSFFIPSCL